MADLVISTSVYSGPLDLLLFLVRKAEVDVHDLPVAEVADQYINELKRFERVDLEFAGEYLVLAAQLLKLKSEIILQASESKAGEDDPRSSLVRQLLEYRKYRELSRELSALQDEAVRWYGRPPGLVPDHQPEDIYLDEVTVYDLYRQQARLTREVTGEGQHRIIFDERPIEEYISLILDQLRSRGSVDFSILLGDRPVRQDVIGNFLALLELVKEQKAVVEQDGKSFRLIGKVEDRPPEWKPENLGPESARLAPAEE